jgi:hypothetical protein
MNPSTVDPAEYCRQLERYLCQKNEGHLIRIVGPVFAQVCGWAAEGVPLAIACRGVDQYCKRYYAKGPRRRPVRIEFCEADILELFDVWRRAVGVSRIEASDDAAAPGAADEAGGRRDTLPSHLDRAIARLTAVRTRGRPSAAFDQVLDDAARQLDRERAAARGSRGDARQRIIDRLAALDRLLLTAAGEESGEQTRESLRREAQAELAPFAARMRTDALAHAIDVAYTRLLRDALGLPTLIFD